MKTRFAPSPTGVLHLGSIRTALFAWLHARHFGAKFVLRIEDTDRERSTEENVTAILEGLAWLGLDYDEGPYFQTDRYDRYNEVIEEWLAKGKAYRCFCTREELDAVREQQQRNGEKTRYNGKCRDLGLGDSVEPHVVRFRNPRDGEVVVEDLVRGRVVFQNAELDDLIIRRSSGDPTYNFTVAIDDFDMQITHVIRGDDHLNNTPRQMNMLNALDVPLPKYAHLPMILGVDGAKLSKRHGAVDIRDFRQQGFLPAAMLNYLARLGWSHKDQEIFSVDELISLFDVSDVNSSPSAFDPEKLRWLNQQHLIALPVAELASVLEPYLVAEGYDLSAGPAPALVAEAYGKRAATLAELAQKCRYCYQDFDEIDAAAAKKNLRPVVLAAMQDLRERLQVLESWSRDGIAEAVESCAAAHGMKMGKLGQPLRVAVTGESVSPPIDITLELIGRHRSIDRIRHAIAFIEKRVAAD